MLMRKGFDLSVKNGCTAPGSVSHMKVDDELMWKRVLVADAVIVE